MPRSRWKIPAALVLAAGFVAGISAYASTPGPDFGIGCTEEKHCDSDLNISGDGKSCTMYGPAYEFSLTTPDGWTLRPSSRDQEGKYATYYPEDRPWIMSEEVIYAFGVPKDEWVRSAGDAMKEDMKYYEGDCPGYAMTEGPRLATSDGGRYASVRRFACGEGMDSVAYIDEEGAVIVIALSAGTVGTHKTSLPAFEQLVGSYRYRGTGHISSQ